MVEVCRALAPSPLFGKGRYVNTKPVFLLVSCPPASHLPLLEVGARAGPGLSQVALPILIITDFPWATQVSPLGWNIQERILHTPLFFISSCSGADWSRLETWHDLAGQICLFYFLRQQLLLLLLHISQALLHLQCYQGWSQHPWKWEKLPLASAGFWMSPWVLSRAKTKMIPLQIYPGTRKCLLLA